jgi:hypothetical protein
MTTITLGVKGTGDAAAAATSWGNTLTKRDKCIATGDCFNVNKWTLVQMLIVGVARSTGQKRIRRAKL